CKYIFSPSLQTMENHSTFYLLLSGILRATWAFLHQPLELKTLFLTQLFTVAQWRVEENTRHGVNNHYPYFKNLF
ncbi:MAG: hypothetical protein WAQ93_05335, partial [Chitinophagaceae bacterium]